MIATQQARTVHAWSRTVSAVVTLVVVGVGIAFQRGAGPGTLSVAALLPAAAIAVLSRRRARTVINASPPPPLPPRTALVLVATVLAADAVGIVLLLV